MRATVSKNGVPTWYATPNKNEVASHIAAQCVRLGLKVLLFSQSPRDTNAIAKHIDALVTEECTSVEHNILKAIYSISQSTRLAGKTLSLVLLNALAAITPTFFCGTRIG